jgi:hypothetical protein
MLLLSRQQGAWAKQKAPSDAGGAWGKDVVVEFLARDSFPDDDPPDKQLQMRSYRGLGQRLVWCQKSA